jgi:hypothetical protein
MMKDAATSVNCSFGVIVAKSSSANLLGVFMQRCSSDSKLGLINIALLFCGIIH